MVHYPLLTRVVPLTTIHRERLLPFQGEVLVHEGARVEPTTIVAQANVPGRYRILNIARELKVSPESADRYVRPKSGNLVKAGQVVARRRAGLGLFPRVVRAPQDGAVAAVGGGRVLLQTPGEPVEIRAHLPGVVTNVFSKLGVMIETTGALIQGVWGSGGESFGVLKVLVDQPDQPLDVRSIDVSCHGAVLVGGSTMDQEVIQQALELQVRGILVGSLAPDVLEVAMHVPFPIVVTEGLETAPMAGPIFQLLRTNEGREAAVSGHPRNRWDSVRPEVIIPLPAEGAPVPPASDKPLAVGAKVRVMRGPMKGAVGTIRNLPQQPILLETDARVPGALVAFEGQMERKVPILNLELLG